MTGTAGRNTAGWDEPPAAPVVALSFHQGAAHLLAQKKEARNIVQHPEGCASLNNPRRSRAHTHTVPVE